MRGIYAKAYRVIVWIGKEKRKDLEAFRLAKSLYKKYDGKQYHADTGRYGFEDFDYKPPRST